MCRLRDQIVTVAALLKEERRLLQAMEQRIETLERGRQRVSKRTRAEHADLIRSVTLHYGVLRLLRARRDALHQDFGAVEALDLGAPVSEGFDGVREDWGDGYDPAILNAVVADQRREREFRSLDLEGGRVRHHIA